jgi:hypothetical protein
MGVSGRRGAERLEHEQLPGRIREMVLSADHERDGHLEVVYRDREVVERRAIGARDHEVVEETMLEDRPSSDDVLDHGLALVRDSQPHGRPGGPLRNRLAPISGPAAAALQPLHVFGCRGIPVGGARPEELVEPFRVAVRTLGLAKRTLVPTELEPLERVEDLGDRLVGRALSIGVLESQDQAVLGRLAREKPVVECRPRAADVEETGRARREPQAMPGHEGRC